MKKLIACLTLALPFAFAFTACKKKTDYYNYVSEYRKSVFIYDDDDFSLKIYCSERETPYALDGVKGDTGEVTEVYFTCKNQANEVEIELLGKGGEMSWLAVTRNYYLSFSGADLNGSAGVPVTVTVDGASHEFTVPNVAAESTIDGKTALDCVVEYDGESFKNLTENGRFAGEICIRLIYDDGCYYYVGVCDRNSRVHAYLVDGTDGRIIAERQSEAER